VRGVDESPAPRRWYLSPLPAAGAVLLAPIGWYLGLTSLGVLAAYLLVVAWVDAHPARPGRDPVVRGGFRLLTAVVLVLLLWNVDRPTHRWWWPGVQIATELPDPCRALAAAVHVDGPPRRVADDDDHASCRRGDDGVITVDYRRHRSAAVAKDRVRERRFRPDSPVATFGGGRVVLVGDRGNVEVTVTYAVPDPARYSSEAVLEAGTLYESALRAVVLR
jgi:hypothetical protein